MVSYTAIIDGGDKGTFGVIFPEVPGCFSAGSSIEETTTNAAEALAFYLEDLDDWPVPQDPESLSVGAEVREVARVPIAAPSR